VRYPLKKTLVIFFSIIILIIGLGFYIKEKPNHSLSNEFKNKDNHIVYDGDVLDYQGIKKNKDIFIPYELIKEKIDPYIYNDTKINNLIITNAEHVIRIENGTGIVWDNEVKKQVTNSAFKQDRTWYVPLSLLKEYYPVSITYSEKNSLFSLHLLTEERKTSILKEEKKQNIRLEASIKSPINATVSPGEKVFVLQTRDNWTLVQKKNGYYGYIKTDSLSSPKSLPKETVKKAEKKTPVINGKINLVWELISQGKINTATIPPMEGVNVISPTWYSLADGDGNVRSIADLDYVAWAHARGYQVWGLFSNDFDPGTTKQMLHSYTARQRAISQMISYATAHQLNGINVDFENVHTEEKDSLIQFIRELTPVFHAKGLFVSIDVPPIANSDMWSNFLNREAIGETVDYMALMAYDEHWASSPKSGSVASLPWTEQSVTNLIGQVPHEKIILGMPTYTRMWKEENGKVSSDVFAMIDTRNWLISHNLRPNEDSKTKQNYIEIKEGNALYKIWIEDHKSLTRRVDLVHQYDLAGVGVWERKYTLNETWKVISDALHK